MLLYAFAVHRPKREVPGGISSIDEQELHQRQQLSTERAVPVVDGARDAGWLATMPATMPVRRSVLRRRAVSSIPA